MSSPPSSFYFFRRLPVVTCAPPIITVPDMILKMIYSPHFKDKLLSIDKIINDSQGYFYKEQTKEDLQLIKYQCFLPEEV